MKIDGPTIALILSVLGLVASLFLTKLGDDVRKNRFKNQCISRRQYIRKAIKKHWQAKEAPQSVLVP